VKKSFNIPEFLHRKSKHHGSKPMHPSSSKALQRYQEQASQFGGSLNYKTKQNKLPSLIDRWARYEHDYAQRFQSQLERRLWRNQNAFICVL
jgi:hypothetical protein